MLFVIIAPSFPSSVLLTTCAAAAIVGWPLFFRWWEELKTGIDVEREVE